MSLIRSSLVALALTFSFVSLAKADPFSIISTTYQLTGADATQLGRPSRNSVPQDWSGTEAYPGAINLTSTYFYKTFTFAAATFAGAPYIEISTFDPANGVSYFLSAYANSYDVNNRAANWLGDVGFSGDYQTNDGGDMEVILPSASDLVLVLNSTGAGAALPGYPFTINVGAYSDAAFSDPVPTPEPSSLLLAGTGLLSLAAAARKRFA